MIRDSLDDDPDNGGGSGAGGGVPSVSAIVPAAGASTRMGGDVRKPWLELAGEPILYRTCRRLRELPGVREIILAVHPEDLESVRESRGDALSDLGVTLIVPGGSCRAASVWSALSACDPTSELIAVHDAVRPFLSKDIAKALFQTAAKRGAAVPIVPMADTPKRIEGDVVTETVRRRGLVRVQTPQVFRRDLFLAANEYALSTGGFTDAVTDDASLVEAYGQPVTAVFSEEYNFKITTPRDLRMAEALLQAGVVA